jgi:hypothetical protein
MLDGLQRTGGEAGHPALRILRRDRRQSGALEERAPPETQNENFAPTMKRRGKMKFVGSFQADEVARELRTCS